VRVGRTLVSKRGTSGSSPYMPGWEVQRLLNQKVDSKLSEIVDFASKIVLVINSKLKIRIFNNYYES
jgi:hypothetical protein